MPIKGDGVKRYIDFVDRLNELIANVLGWLAFAMVLATCTLVILRYLFNAGNLVFLQELIIYLHATTFMLGAAWVLKRDGHVRVDVFYRSASRRCKAWVNSLGTLIFLLPFAFFLLFSSRSFVERSWQLLESSPEPGGIPAVFLLKTLIPLAAVLLILQGTVELVRAAITLTQNTGNSSDD